MQELGHLAVDLEDALPGIGGVSEGLDDSLGLFDIMGAGGEDAVCLVQLGGVDQRLAIKAQVAALLALVAEAAFILDVVIDAVDGGEAIGAGGGDGELEAPSDQGFKFLLLRAR